MTRVLQQVAHDVGGRYVTANECDDDVPYVVMPFGTADDLHVEVADDGAEYVLTHRSWGVNATLEYEHEIGRGHSSRDIFLVIQDFLEQADARGLSAVEEDEL